jgi:hypothetical protein
MADRSKRTKFLFFWFTILAIGPLAPAGAREFDEWNPPKTDAALLPHFCWGPPSHMGHFDVTGPEFEIPKDTCGIAMNHYCNGLVQIIWANRMVGNKNSKRIFLEQAKSSTLYTLKGMVGYPDCPIREHVEKTLQQIEGELRALR